RAAVPDRLVEHRLDALDQALGALVRRAGFGGDRRRDAFRRESRAIESLADVDVAEPGNDALIGKRRLEGRLLSPASARQRRGAEGVAERLGAEPAQERLGLEVLPWHDLHRAEAARIVERNDRARRHMKYDVVVRAVLG